MHNCNFTDCQFDILKFVPDSTLLKMDWDSKPPKNQDVPEVGVFTSRKRAIYCVGDRYYFDTSKRDYTCTNGEPWRPYPLPTCLKG